MSIESLKLEGPPQLLVRVGTGTWRLKGAEDGSGAVLASSRGRLVVVRDPRLMARALLRFSVRSRAQRAELQTGLQALLEGDWQRLKLGAPPHRSGEGAGKTPAERQRT